MSKPRLRASGIRLGSVSKRSPAERRLAVYYVGIDVHQKRSSVEILDCNGKLFKRFEVKGTWAALVEELAKTPKPFAVCYEASCGYGHLFEQFSKLSDQVRVAHPGG